MATIPNKIEKFAAAEKDEFSSIAQASWGKMAGLLEYLNKSYPIGMLLFFEATQSNLPALPDTQYWKLADGSVVVNANSPLNGQTLPDLRGRFIKHPGTGQPFNVTGGSDTKALAHNHGGFTGFASDVDSVILDNGGERGVAIGNHRHTISDGSLGTVSIIPRYRYLQIYVRIA